MRSCQPQTLPRTLVQREMENSRVLGPLPTPVPAAGLLQPKGLDSRAKAPSPWSFLKIHLRPKGPFGFKLLLQLGSKVSKEEMTCPQ